MKKIILLFFIMIPLFLSAEKVIIDSEFFSNNQVFQEYINNNLDNKKDLRNNINKYFTYKGYVFTDVDMISFSREPDETLIVINEGRIKKIKIEGNKKISNRVIKNYLYFKKGDVFNKKRLRLQIKKLLNIGLFESIKYDISIPQKSILITIVEKKRIDLTLSGNYTEKYGIMPYVGVINRRFWKENIYMNINAECGFRDKLNYYKFNMKYIIFGLHLDLFHRKSKTFIKQN